MTAPGRVRDEQRAASEAAILEAARDLFARRGPDGASMRDIGANAGCTHGLIPCYYGSKDGLVDAVASQLGTGVDRVVRRATTTADDPALELLSLLRTQRSCQQLLIRSALGDLPPREFPACLHLEWLLAEVPDSDTIPVAPAEPGRRARLCAYAAASLLLGFMTFEGFLVAATGLGPLHARRRDAAIATTSRHLLDLAGEPEPRLAPRDLSAARVLGTAAQEPPATSREALLRSAIELFAERGPASVPVRDIARHAGANQGLIYRHFGSKDALLAEAIEQASAGMFPAALAVDGFDFDAMSWMLHHTSTAPRLIARTLVDDVEISTVRQRFPILRRLIADHDHVPSGAGPADLSDPRVAVAASAAMTLGSAVWGDHLRGALGLGERDGIEAAIADLARLLVAAPALATDMRGSSP